MASATITATASTPDVPCGVKPAPPISLSPVVSEKAAKAPTQSRAVHEVRALRLDEYKAAAQTLAEAFFQDDVGRYFLDTPTRKDWTEKQKWDLHLSIYEYVTYAHIMCGLATTAGEDYGCVALWMPPGKHTDGFYTLLRSGLWRLNYKLCKDGRRRMFEEFFPLLHDTKAEIMSEHDHDSWYLVYLGTRESARGQGLARAVMTHTLDQVDAERKCAYLESSNPVNLGFYGRLGFVTAKTITMTKSAQGISLDCMRREPKAADVMIPSDHAVMPVRSPGNASSREKKPHIRGIEVHVLNAHLPTLKEKSSIKINIASNEQSILSGC